MSKPFWGRVAVSEVVGAGGLAIQRDALTFPEKTSPLAWRAPDLSDSPERVVGQVNHIWYGDESGLQVVLFDGEWGPNHGDYDDTALSPFLFVSKIEQQRVEGAFGGSFHKVTSGQVVNVMLQVSAFMPAWEGLFIKSEPLPEGLRNRGRII